MYYESRDIHFFIAYFLFSLFCIVYCRFCDWRLVYSIRKLMNENLLILCLIIIILNVWLIIIVILTVMMWLSCDYLEWAIIIYYSYIYILQRTSESDKILVNFRTTPKSLNKFYILQYIAVRSIQRRFFTGLSHQILLR
jgi:hypothetical protein